MTLRLTVICALTALVASAYGTPEAALSVHIAFFLIRPDRVLSAILPAMMLLLVSVILGVILLVTTASIDYPILRVSAMALLSAGFLFLASASKLRPIGAILAMIVGFGLDQMGRVPIGEASTRMLLYAWLLVAIPAGAAIVAGLLLAPSPRRLACDRLARRLEARCRTAERQCGQHPAFALTLREGNKQILTWLKLSALAVRRADAARAAPCRRLQHRHSGRRGCVAARAAPAPTRWRGHWPARWRTWRPCTNRAAIPVEIDLVAVGHAAAARAAPR